MNRGRNVFLFLALAGLLLVQLACEGIEEVAPDYFCEMNGGIWHEAESDMEDSWCEMPEEPQTAGVTDESGTGNECVIPQNSFAWFYRDFNRTSGTAGVLCNARFVVRNIGAEPFYLIVYTSFNTNAMQGDKWAAYRLPPGGEWGERVNRTNYTDGVITYSKVGRILTIRDTAECTDLLSDENQALWEAQSLSVDELAC